jgi:hypothetical protein
VDRGYAVDPVLQAHPDPPHNPDPPHKEPDIAQQKGQNGSLAGADGYLTGALGSDLLTLSIHSNRCIQHESKPVYPA